MYRSGGLFSSLSKIVFSIIFLSTIVSCEKEGDSDPVYNAADSATVIFTVTSNQRCPLVFIDLDGADSLVTINLTGYTDTVPISRTFRIGQGLHQASAWLIRDSSNLYLNMLDSNPAWIKIEAILNGQKIAEGIGEPIPETPINLVANLYFNY